MVGAGRDVDAQRESDRLLAYVKSGCEREQTNGYIRRQIMYSNADDAELFICRPNRRRLWMSRESYIES